MAAMPVAAVCGSPPLPVRLAHAPVQLEAHLLPPPLLPWTLPPALLPPQVLCSVPDVQRVLQEAARVLKPGGSFLFIEHTLAQQVGACWVAASCL